jgi:pSer/pThr/pTyr-binding forkhead associated (FHA) protein
MIECGRCGISNAADLFFCTACGARLVSSEVLPDETKRAGIARLRGVVERLVSARRGEGELARAPLAYLPPIAEKPAAGFRLVQLNGDGTDGPVHLLGAAAVDIGRTSGDLVFDDPYLAGRHARIASTAEGHVLTPLEKRNGVFRRLRGPAELAGGDRILIGRQLLVFEVVAELERGLTVGNENGQIIFGSRTRASWGRLMQLTPAGVPRDVYHLDRSEIVVGRERTDLVISDDELLSTRHARLSRKGARFYVEDLASMNGTFLSIRSPHLLASGDVIRMGNEVLRFEA